MRYVSSKDLKAYTNEMKLIYKAATEDAGLMTLAAFADGWFVLFLLGNLFHLVFNTFCAQNSLVLSNF